jgi:putative YjhG/YagF family dehydratase
VFRRLIRSLPNRSGVLGVATCDKGLPAMMMALAGSRDLPCVIVPGGVSLPPADGEDAGAVQTLGARFSHGRVTLEEAADLGCRACATPGGGCQFLGTAATSQVVAEALGLALPHSALAPSGQPIWTDMAVRSARALARLADARIRSGDVVCEASLRNAMALHAAFGGSTNLLIHVPAIAHAAGLPRPTIDDWAAINRRVPRIVSVLPNGPVHHPTVRVFLAGGVPEVMLHLRRLGLLDTGVLTAAGTTLDAVLDWWEGSERRRRLRDRLLAADGVDPDDVILPPERARAAGLAGTVACLRGNLAPQGAIVKSTAIDTALASPDGVVRIEGPARVFVREADAIAAIKDGRIHGGDVLVVAGLGPLGTGMEETYQLTSALKFLSFGGQVALVTDGRFSGVSTGPCVGHVGPEALAGGPIGKLEDGDTVRIEIDLRGLSGSVDLVAEDGRRLDAEQAGRVLAARPTRSDVRPHHDLPDDTRLWAALQATSGGVWGGCVYDAGAIAAALGRRAAGSER